MATLTGADFSTMAPCSPAPVVCNPCGGVSRAARRRARRARCNAVPIDKQLILSFRPPSLVLRSTLDVPILHKVEMATQTDAEIAVVGSDCVIFDNADKHVPNDVLPRPWGCFFESWGSYLPWENESLCFNGEFVDPEFPCKPPGLLLPFYLPGIQTPLATTELNEPQDMTHHFSVHRMCSKPIQQGLAVQCSLCFCEQPLATCTAAHVCFDCASVARKLTCRTKLAPTDDSVLGEVSTSSFSSIAMTDASRADACPPFCAYCGDQLTSVQLALIDALHYCEACEWISWPNDICRNQKVTIGGLASAAGQLLNSLTGRVESYNRESGRFGVRIPGLDALRALRPENLFARGASNTSDSGDDHIDETSERDGSVDETLRDESAPEGDCFGKHWGPTEFCQTGAVDDVAGIVTCECCSEPCLQLRDLHGIQVRCPCFKACSL